MNKNEERIVQWLKIALYISGGVYLSLKLNEIIYWLKLIYLV